MSDAKALARQKVNANRKKKKQIYKRRVKIQNQHNGNGPQEPQQQKQEGEVDDDAEDDDDDDVDVDDNDNDNDNDDEIDDEAAAAAELLRIETERAEDAFVREIAIAHAAKRSNASSERAADPLDAVINDRHARLPPRAAAAAEPRRAPTSVDKKELDDWLDDIV